MRSLFLSLAIAAVMGPLLARTVSAQDDAAPPPPPLVGDIAHVLRTAFAAPFRGGAEPTATPQAEPALAPTPVPPAKNPPKSEAVTAPAIDEQPVVRVKPGQGFIIEEITEQPAPAPIKRTYRVTPAPASEPALAPTPVPPAAPAQTQAQAVTGTLKPANALQRAIGRLGQKLTTVGYDRVLVPRGTATVQVSYLVQNAAPVQAVTAPQSEPALTPVTPSPQAPRKGCLLRR